jgi:glycosyltransferase involved in cell wall biosynthesis
MSDPHSVPARSEAAHELLSIIVPVYNEQDNVREIINRLLAVDFVIPREVVAVDDGSTDASARILAELAVEHPDALRVFYSKQNVGKGAALRIGFDRARGSIITVQDADLEYDPRQFNQLLAPLLAGECWVVYGSRYRGGNQVGWLNRLGNGFLSLVTSMLYWSWITDMETCYKVFRRELLDRIQLASTGFEIEPELTVKLLCDALVSIRELPISYQPRTRQSGKKIHYLRDGWIALGWLVRLRLRFMRSGKGPWPIERLRELVSEDQPMRPKPAIMVLPPATLPVDS